MTTAQTLQVMMVNTDFEAAITALENECWDDARQCIADALEKIDELQSDVTGIDVPAKPGRPGGASLPPSQQILDV